MKAAPMTPEEAAKHLLKRRMLAQQQAYGLGIALYLRDDGRIAPDPPVGLDLIRWERIEPGKGAVPLEGQHGQGNHGIAAEAKAKP